MANLLTTNKPPHPNQIGRSEMPHVEKNLGSSEVSLEVKNVTLTFGKIACLSNVWIDFKENEIVSIIGPNGAGKTSIVNCINGFYKPDQRRIVFEGNDITRLRPDLIAKMGIGRTFQNIQLYTGLTTLENIMSGRHLKIKCGFVSNAFFYGRSRNEEIMHRQIVEEIIEFLNLQDIRRQVVGGLPYGKRKIIELGRALALEPKILILDEPMVGMNFEEKEDMARYIIDILQGQKRGYDAEVLKKGIRSII